MQFAEERNVLRIGPPKHPGQAEITPAMVDALRQRIRDAGGILNVWTVLFEDVYESKFGDGFYLYLRGIALNSADANKLASLAGGDTEHEKWHVRSYRLALKDDAPVFTALWRPEERFTINDIIELLPEIPYSGTASKLHTGSGYRKDGPLLSLS